MPSHTFKFGVYTRYGTVAEYDALSVHLPSAGGSLGVWPGRAPILCALQLGSVECFLPDGDKEVLAVSGGFAEVSREGVTLLCPSAERLQDIDMQRAERALERARQRLEASRTEQAGTIDETRARLALERALNRLRLAERR